MSTPTFGPSKQKASKQSASKQSTSNRPKKDLEAIATYAITTDVNHYFWTLEAIDLEAIGLEAIGGADSKQSRAEPSQFRGRLEAISGPARTNLGADSKQSRGRSEAISGPARSNLGVDSKPAWALPRCDDFSLEAIRR